ncbi:MAG: enoyl-CoA hydratase/isomerase family protein [Pseudomonadales bacterium]|nr:enoyl-CoA hydratase/isomerase family protein [Halioglobus sp.]MCP5123729.1 enoyl-CoA hydratase/isomerase family protein [Pseudomonadales bacterium]MCP5192050.1 enoyl-CoA hydratase/isomerase family protein [Pseudomonadales bacterium]
MFNTLEVAVDGAIGSLWLNRPQRLNALSGEVLRELAGAARWFDEQDGVRVVLVGGRGRAFCAGADLDGFPAVADAGVRQAADLGRLMAEAIEGMRAVTVARIQGWCVGGGLVLAAACDLRVASESARFSIPEIDLGIPLAWGGIPRLVREIGPALTKELVITCREFSPREAQAAGFLNRVVTDSELDAVVQALAAQVAAKPAMPVIATKRHVNAVTAQMVGTVRAWSDADGLVGGLLDPECGAARQDYIKGRGR